MPTSSHTEKTATHHPLQKKQPHHTRSRSECRHSGRGVASLTRVLRDVVLQQQLIKDQNAPVVECPVGRVSKTLQHRGVIEGGRRVDERRGLGCTLVHVAEHARETGASEHESEETHREIVLIRNPNEREVPTKDLLAQGNLFVSWQGMPASGCKGSLCRVIAHKHPQLAARVVRRELEFVLGGCGGHPVVVVVIKRGEDSLFRIAEQRDDTAKRLCADASEGVVRTEVSDG
mmetsp:Transcript_17820/g.48063  ORF Transcript_17820/g.48063 Transcript_17820/m.48063 type:complete len:232 (-) Transcript_17820:500-1195(-)